MTAANIMIDYPKGKYSDNSFWESGGIISHFKSEHCIPDFFSNSKTERHQYTSNFPSFELARKIQAIQTQTEICTPLIVKKKKNKQNKINS